MTRVIKKFRFLHINMPKIPGKHLLKEKVKDIYGHIYFYYYYYYDDGYDYQFDTVNNPNKSSFTRCVDQGVSRLIEQMIQTSNHLVKEDHFSGQKIKRNDNLFTSWGMKLCLSDPRSLDQKFYGPNCFYTLIHVLDRLQCRFLQKKTIFLND